ncbi:thioesterase II family protein [Paenibacillus zanthoxyli]|uniref:thioesterase II family protein n=1 Tax=Paenibacillus zanthoxyli TaxID=369399 RepID=UPI000472277B|nr:thioesterase domain-containing protein [Paenibacillus zanthoxyli]
MQRVKLLCLPYAGGSASLFNKWRQFINVLRAFGGTPDEILDNPYVLDIILPILKNDFQMIENYKFVEKDESIACDMTILTGRSDNNIRFEDLLLWKKLSDCSSHIYEMNGGHFFITEYPEEVTRVINQVLSAKSLNSSGGRTI